MVSIQISWSTICVFDFQLSARERNLFARQRLAAVASFRRSGKWAVFWTLINLFRWTHPYSNRTWSNYTQCVDQVRGTQFTSGQTFHSEYDWFRKPLLSFSMAFTGYLICKNYEVYTFTTLWGCFNQNIYLTC